MDMRNFINLLENEVKPSDPNAEAVITLEVSGDLVKKLVEFLQKIKSVAEVGHSFDVEADREDAAEYDDGKYPRFGFDGDGSDCIHKIFLNGKDVTK